ncbi:putative spermidine/putrescine transport system permease protein/spermidine/putrescine transport system permease protein [Rhodoligotrophos appendicifer]|uniref:ABC transporter permease n=1 Tax=Rhodoligotrophos appendicifer TaxID=987056 RepID=UPI001184C4FD|nr:ABC transporter permease [Rhodoligotrophos appendicifer]
MAENAALLSRVERRNRLRIGLLSAAAVLIVTVLLLLPILWLFGLSFTQKGAFSLVHYQRLIDLPSYRAILLQTFRVSVMVTALSIILGYPVAYMIAQLPAKLAGLLLALILIPFWTSTLVRSYAWLVLLRDQGPVNEALVWTGIMSGPLNVLFTESAAVIGMTHIMLPFFVLPLYAGIRSFDWSLAHAATSLGAPPTSTFLRVFLPLSLPATFAGAVLVFVQCLGFYVTPAVLGGGNVTMVSMKIASNIEQYFDWGAASSYGMVLLICTLAILYTAHRLLDLNKVMTAR